MAHTGLLVLCFWANLDERVKDDLILVPEESEQAADVFWSEFAEIGEGVSGED
jgi:hypothetical protein